MEYPKFKTSGLRHNSGFTVIEIIITITIITAISVLGATVGFDVYRSGTLSVERDLLVSSLEKARSFAMTNVGESSHGLYVEDNRHILFRGDSYPERNTDYDLEVVNSPKISSTGTVEFVFEQLSGDGIAHGTLTLTDDRGMSVSISVNEEGGINW